MSITYPVFQKRVPILRNTLVRHSQRMLVNAGAAVIPATIRKVRSHPSGAASMRDPLVGYWLYDDVIRPGPLAKPRII